VYSVKFAMLPPPHPQSTNDRTLEPAGHAEVSLENEAVLMAL